jgi:hypothetical protein
VKEVKKLPATATNPNIIDLEDYTESINMCIYSDSGVGKTVFAGTDNVLFLALKAEKGTISAKRMGSKGKVWKINDWNELDDAYDWLYEHPNHGFDWVVIDSVTAMQKQLMASILERDHKANPKRNIDRPEIQNWQEFYNGFDRMVVAFNDLPVNVLYLATVMQNEDPEGEEVVIPNLYGRGSGYSVSAGFCASLMVVGYLYKEVTGKKEQATSVRKIQFDNLPPIFAKDRYNCLPRFYTVSEGTKQVGNLRDIRRIIESSAEPKQPAKKTTAVPRRTTRIPAKPGIKRG